MEASAVDAASDPSRNVTRPSEWPAAALGRLGARSRRNTVRAGLPLLALAFFVANGLWTARTDTPTVDEFVYLPAGYYHLRTGDLTLDPTNPPLLKMMMALPLLSMDLRLDDASGWRDDRTGWGPWIYGTRFMELNRERFLDAFFAARLVALAIGVALGVLVFHCARSLLSPVGALATVALYATMPPILAHSALATLDIGVSALLFAALLALDRFAVSRRWSWAAATGVLLGLAFTAKGVTALFLPLVPVLVGLRWGAWNRTGVQRLGGGLVVIGVAAWLAVLAVYRFSGCPLPAPLIEGLRFQMAASGTGEFPAFLNGRWSQTGWWYYYLVALLLKTPLPTLVFIVAGAVAVTRRRPRDRRDLWLVLPPLFLLYVLSFHYGKNYGVRYLLPAFPFLLLLAGRGIDALLARGNTVIVAMLLLWQLVSCALGAPYHLAYFNELAGGPDHARRILLDSNLDWGQDLGRLKRYLDSRGIDRVCLGYFGHVDPGLYGIAFSLPPSRPTAGLCAVSANFLAGYPYAVTYAGERILGVRAGAWSWFDRHRPVARIGRSIYVFDVTADDIARIGSASDAGTKGMPP